MREGEEDKRRGREKQNTCQQCYQYSHGRWLFLDVVDGYDTLASGSCVTVDLFTVSARGSLYNFSCSAFQNNMEFKGFRVYKKGFERVPVRLHVETIGSNGTQLFLYMRPPCLLELNFSAKNNVRY